MRLIPLVKLLTQASKGKITAEEFLAELGDEAPTGGQEAIPDVRPALVVGLAGSDLGVTFEEALAGYLDILVREAASRAMEPLVKAAAAALGAAILSALLSRGER